MKATRPLWSLDELTRITAAIKEAARIGLARARAASRRAKTAGEDARRWLAKARQV